MGLDGLGLESNVGIGMQAKDFGVVVQRQGFNILLNIEQF